MNYLCKVLVVALLAVKTLGWGELGHRAIAYLASDYLTVADLEYVIGLLDFDDISDAAIWADEISPLSAFAFSRSWHYINVHDSAPAQCGIDLSRDRDLDRGDVLGAIVNHTGMLRNDRSTVPERAQAMAFLIHWIGDVHQPLHTEALERGGVDLAVYFDSRSTNIHAVWDYEIPNKFRGGEVDKNTARRWADELYRTDPHPAINMNRECSDITNPLECAMLWASEANSWVCKYVLGNGTRHLKHANLSNEYYGGAVPIVNELMLKAGRRLGAWLTALAAAHVCKDQGIMSPLQLPLLALPTADRDSHDASEP